MFVNKIESEFRLFGGETFDLVCRKAGYHENDLIINNQYRKQARTSKGHVYNKRISIESTGLSKKRKNADYGQPNGESTMVLSGRASRSGSRVSERQSK